jgi:hypothetical protein
MSRCLQESYEQRRGSGCVFQRIKTSGQRNANTLAMMKLGALRGCACPGRSPRPNASCSIVATRWRSRLRPELQLLPFSFPLIHTRRPYESNDTVSDSQAL